MYYVTRVFLFSPECPFLKSMQQSLYSKSILLGNNQKNVYYNIKIHLNTKGYMTTIPINSSQ